MFKGVVIGGSGDVLKGWRGGGPKCGTDCENGEPDCGKDWSDLEKRGGED